MNPEDRELTLEHTLGVTLTLLLFVGERSWSVELPRAGSVVVGRGSEADLNLGAEGVSRKHIRLDVAQGRVTLHDLGSKNGTYVNDKREREARVLLHGDEVRIGEARLVLSQKSPSETDGPRLFVHGAFVERLRIEVARSIGFGRPISMLLVALPDRWDNLAVAGPLAATLRPVDLSGLYDDSTLEIALLETSEDQARAQQATLIETLRAAGVVATSGSATLRGRGGSAEELQELALGALRRATGEEPPKDPRGDRPIIADAVMLRIHEQIRRIAPSPISVLIEGETGVGKEVIAHAVHAESRRRGKLVCINTAALPEALLESELFGHERGAFTGATQPKSGLFEAAHEGTLFLDEIGELPLPMQAKLLRVLEDQTVRRVGASSDRKVDVRVVAATNCALAQQVEQKTFRRDLLFRLNGCTFVIPPLRDRVLEIPLFAERFLARAAALGGRRLVITKEAMRLLEAHAWPGNVRELRNVIERAAALCAGTGGQIEPRHLPDNIAAPRASDAAFTPLPSPAGSGSMRDAMQSAERERILSALSRADGNITRAAELLGLPRRTLGYRLEKLGIKLPKG